MPPSLSPRAPAASFPIGVATDGRLWAPSPRSQERGGSSGPTLSASCLALSSASPAPPRRGRCRDAVCSECHAMGAHVEPAQRGTHVGPPAPGELAPGGSGPTRTPSPGAREASVTALCLLEEETPIPAWAEPQALLTSAVRTRFPTCLVRPTGRAEARNPLVGFGVQRWPCLRGAAPLLPGGGG